MNYVTFSYGNMRTDTLLFQSKKDLYSMKKTYGNKTQYVSFFLFLLFFVMVQCSHYNIAKPHHLAYANRNELTSAYFKNKIITPVKGSG